MKRDTLWSQVKTSLVNKMIKSNLSVGEVLVAKMPCLYPGDIRKYTAVNVPKLQACIRDCIVFPIKGHRPHPSEMSGSDLDGDKYWASLIIE